MPPKKLKIDLSSKPAATSEDQELNFEIFQDKLDAAAINTSIYTILVQNLALEVFSQEALSQDHTKKTLIPESPSRRGQAFQPTFGFSIISPRSILSPHFQATTEFPVDQPHITEAAPQPVAPVKAQTFQTIKDISLPVLKLQDQEEIDIVEALCAAHPEGITLHSTGPHPAHAKSTLLSKRYGRTQFEADEEVRLVNDVLFEGVFGLPGFLAWNALPLALAHYGGEFTVAFMEDQLLSYGETITQLFAGDSKNQKKFILTPNMLRRWYADCFAGKTVHERLFNVMKLPTNDTITVNDLQRVTQILLRLHPGLAFLNETPQFQQLYAQTAALRVLFENDTSMKGCLSCNDLKKIQGGLGTRFSSDLASSQRLGGILDSLWQSQYEQDINRNLKCFSYEHFYVFYVTFWELDKDHDKLLTIFDLEHYADNCLSRLAVKRTFDLLIAIRRRQWTLYDSYYEEKVGKKGATKEQMLQFFDQNKNFLFYTDFVRFLILLENPDLDAAVDFWFEVCDMDADGVIGWLDFKAFFDQQREHMETAGMDIIEAQDAFCQMVDFYKLRRPGYVQTETDSVAAIGKLDIQRSQARGNIFSVMFHFSRLQQFDQKDPYTIRQYMSQESTMWERFCRRQYDTQVQGQSSTQTTTNNSQSSEYMM